MTATRSRARRHTSRFVGWSVARTVWPGTGGARPGRRRSWLYGVLALWCLSACSGSPRTAPELDDAPELIGVWYTVERGDSVSLIARRHGVPLEDIIELNGLADPNALEVGQQLFLYGIDELLERKQAESRAKATKKPEAVASASSAAGSKPPRRATPSRSTSSKPPAGQRAARSTYVWPVDGGRLTSGFGPRGRRVHKGIDIAAKPGTPIKAAAAGKVIYSDNKQRGYGNLVILQHANGAVTVYAHNRRNLVDEGDTVRQGAVIAELGNTGRSTGPHLHFELRLESKAVDPLVYLPAR